ncbi:hypothetical protein ED28_17195 [[Pantoea] beijingensis]|uniref:Uncharacterized protein n=1 Tax=[Pantoea] beijingensis TaxID=1324864 RepID=A0A443I952_9GAMM|nr:MULTISPECIES: hypothetical protein [Erwiniaceae]RWR00599.1 hypothetical protein ED28_17195 [[Pantoea] beijingensis]
MKSLQISKVALARALCASVAIILSQTATAETVTISLSQEQDGGPQGRACIYVYQGKAEFRMIKADESCEPQITVDVKKT